MYFVQRSEDCFPQVAHFRVRFDGLQAVSSVGLSAQFAAVVLLSTKHMLVSREVG